MTSTKQILQKLQTDLYTLQEREAKYGGNEPLELRNQIRDYQTAITLTKQVIDQEITETEWQEAILPLALSSHLLDLAAQITPDLGLHEQAYRQRVKERYAEDAPYYIPLAGETTEVVSAAPAPTPAPRSARRRRQRAGAEYCEWIQAGQEIKRVRLETLRAGVDKYPCVILLGDPGSGKTTALEHLTYEFAVESDTLPLPLRLSEFGPGMTVESFIEQVWGGSLEAGHWGKPELAANLTNYLEAGRLFILFDALNEMPRTGYSDRAQALRRFIDRWSKAGNRFLVTCRVLDYGEELSGLQRVEVRPLNEEQIKTFLQKELPTNWQSLWQELTQGSDDQHRLLDMARNPYLMTIMVDIYVEDGQLGQSRAGLMQRFTQILMNWAMAKVPPADWLETEAQLESLSVTAFEMQKRAGSGTMVETRRVKRVMPQQVQIDPNWPAVPTPPEQVLSLAASANVIEMPIDRSSVRFYHQLLQEYFAARELLNRDPNSLTELWRWPWLEQELPLWVRPEGNYDPLPPPPPTGWEETTILAAGLVPENDEQLVQALIQVNPVLAGRCLHEGRANVGKATRQAVIEALLVTIGRPEVALRVRIAAGEVLGFLGDPRLGQLVTIPAGEFMMGGEGEYDGKPKHRLYLPVYQIGKYPLTNAEYVHFIEAGGYQTRRWWTEAGWQKKEHGNWTEPDDWHDSRFDKPNQPVVGISWYESVAYCRWLRAETGENYRLPTEAEWEKAARGADGQIYPWGNDFDPARCNMSRGGQQVWVTIPGGGTAGRVTPWGDDLDPIRVNMNRGDQQVWATTPVGIYPGGRSPLGVYDCAGNVWEWCATNRGKSYPYDTSENEWAEPYLEGTNGRVLRGGSWLITVGGSARCTFRFDDSPGLRGRGGRVAVSPIS